MLRLILRASARPICVPYTTQLAQCFPPNTTLYCFHGTTFIYPLTPPLSHARTTDALPNSLQTNSLLFQSSIPTRIKRVPTLTRSYAPSQPLLSNVPFTRDTLFRRKSFSLQATFNLSSFLFRLHVPNSALSYPPPPLTRLAESNCTPKPHRHHGNVYM